ncbi:non-ribosomal peptide synthetase/type I polyketide synthase [Actinoplanes aureus]|uniref:Amino acid adenylation domain-containing protein n=1 Tax=Actinoplanes aureus TaxID=2792083 RepID=A0A931CE89_9ACTN|nr:non-ribosomal peptide synthetase/type I polyketide synthase [Actinoplanes aureus]MBG0566372.1 amino acid adenylation domain-containing protein [Actinoplanes aureus]
MNEHMAQYTGTPVVSDIDFPRDITEGLLAAADRHPDAGLVARTFVAYPDLLVEARRVLALLRTRGLRPGGYAIVCGHEDAVAYLSAYWGCVLGGIRPLLAFPGYDSSTTPAGRGLLQRAAEVLGDDSVLLCGPRTSAALDSSLRCVDISDAAAEPPADDLHRPEPAEVAMLMMSSGSTGVPKLIQLTHRGLSEFAAGSSTMLPLEPGDVILNWLPLDHSGAFLLYHLLAVFHGATNVQVPTDTVLADPLVWLDLIEKHRANHTWAPNFAYRLVSQALAEHPDRRWDLSSVRSLVSGGEQITVPVVEEFLSRTSAFGLRPEAFLPVWGMTETTTAITFARPGLGPNVCRVRTSSLSGDLEWADGPADELDTTTFVAVGAPAPGSVVRVIGDDGNTLPEGRIGVLQVASARVTPGYLRDPEADARALAVGEDGTTWLNTGDLAFGRDGQVFIVGRQDDRIILRGQNHYAYEIESAVERAAGVRPGTVAACGVPDEASGTEELAVFVAVEGTDDPAVPVRAARDVLFRRLGLTARVLAVPTDAVPRTASGKVQRGRLRERLLSGELPIVADSSNATTAPTGEVVRRVFRSVLGRDIDQWARFYEIGVDSVGLVRLHEALRRALGVSFPKSAMFEHPSMAALTRYLDTVDSGPGSAATPATGSAPEHRVAIIGMAVRFPGATTLDEYWANLIAGVASVRRFTARELAEAGLPEDVYSRPDFVPVAGALTGIDEFDAGFFGISPAEAARTDPAHRLFLQCCYHALEHSGYADGSGSGRVGVFAGSGMNLFPHRNYLLGNLLPGADSDPIRGMQAAIGTHADFLATRVAYHLGLTGPAVGVQTACSTSLVAIHLAVQALVAGDADMALAGAAAVHVPQVTGYRHFPGSILSPTGQCRAFDAAADGTVGGSGIAAVVLKRLDRAIADGDTVHAVILGSAVNNDGAGKVGFTAPGVAGQVDVIGQAIDRAGVPAETITYLEAHGTGTPLGDPVELRAAAQALAGRTDRVGFCTVGSVKPNLGHLDSCAGMAGLIKTVLMLQHRTMVPLVNFERPNPELDLEGGPLVLGTTVREWNTGGNPRRAGVTALGVGGTNAHLIVEEAPAVPAHRGNDPGERVAVLPLSAAHPEALTELAGKLHDHLRAYPRLDVADLVTTAALGRSHLRYRTAVVGATATELAEALRDATPVEVASGERPPAITFAYGGQGSAFAGMAAELYEAVPAFRDVLDECEEVYRQETGDSLLAYLRDGRAPTPSQDTDLAQPALFAFQMAHTAMWRSLGVEPAFVVGHSAGEYAALCAAGAMNVADGLRLMIARGRLLRRTAPGAMIAVFAGEAAVDDLRTRTGVELAAVNGRTEYVVAGSERAVDEAIGWLDEQAITWHRLAVDRAFHTALLDPVLSEWTGCAAAVPMKPLDIPLASTLTGTLLHPGTVVGAAHLRQQTREPVRFADALAALNGVGCETFLEISPEAVLTGIARRSGTGRRWIAVAEQGTGPLRARSTALAELYSLGANLDWSRIAPGGRRIPLPGYPFRRDRHWTEARPQQAGPEPAGVAPVSDPGPVLARIRELTAREIGVEPAAISPDATFLDHGADSLTMLRVVQQVRRQFGVDIAVRRLFTDAATCRKLAELIGGERGPDVAAPPPAAPALPEADSQSVARVVAEQLRVTGQLLENVTTLMRDQLNMLRGDPAPVAAVPVTVKPSPERVATLAPAMSPERQAADFSLYFFGDYPDSDQNRKYEAIIAAARFADDHGFHGVWLPERHFHSFGGLFPNPVVVAAALARETSRVRINAGSVVLPLHNPIRVAEEWSVVDNLSDGRVGLCVASGWHANDFALRPEAFGRHRELTFEHLETVRRLWSGAAVPATSGSGEAIDVRIYPRPLQPLPPLSVAVVSNPDTYRAAAAADVGVVTNLMVQSVEQLAENIALYRRSRAEHGHDPAGGRVVVLVHTYLGADLERVRAEAYEPFCDYLRSSLSLFGQVTNSLGMRIDEDTPPEDVDFLLERAYQRYCAERALIGTPETVGPIIDRLVRAGADEISCFIDFGLPAEQMLESLNFVDEVRRRHHRDDRTEAPGIALSPAQRGMWFLEQLHPGTLNYHEPKAVRLDGPLDVSRLRRALARVVDRHAPLRTVFRQVNGEPQQVELPAVRVELPVQDRLGEPEAQVLRSVLQEMNVTPIDLAAGPLLRAALIRRGPDRHLLVLCVHHIVFDSFSTAVLLRDLAAFYRSGPDGPDPLPALPVTYAAHLATRTPDADRAARAREYWRRTLAGAPSLALPTDPPRAASGGGSGASLTVDWDADLAARVGGFSRDHQVTPFMTLTAALAGVLGRFSGQHDLVLGTALTHRPPGTEDLIGLFIDTVPLRIDLAGDPSLGELAQRVREVSTEAYEHAGIGFDGMVAAVNPERESSRNPLFQVLIEYENRTDVDFDPPLLRASSVDVASHRAPLDITVYLSNHDHGLQCHVEYNTDLFDERTISAVLRYAESMLRRAAAAPELGLADLTAPTEADRTALAAWSGRPYEQPAAGLHTLFETQARREPDAVALRTELEPVTYRELDRRANALAWRLHDRGVRPDDIVGICLPRGTELIVAILGVLKAGAAYLPLDPAVPLSRLAFMARDSGAWLLVTGDGALAAQLELEAVAVEGAEPRSVAPPPVPVDPDRLAYCIYTSGSTGMPKGVAVPHRGPVNLVAYYLRIRSPMRTLQWVSPSFDVSVQEIFTTLASGAELVLIPNEARYEPTTVAETVRRFGVQRLFMTFTALKYLMDTDPAMPSLREVVSAGEPMFLTPALRSFFAKSPGCALYNEYGPTEASIIATVQRVDLSAGDRPPIGRPVDNVEVHVLDDAGRPVPPGAVGEIHLGGCCLARGYVARPDETAQSFVPVPAVAARRLYRTRDRGRWSPDGALEYLGRVDDQVKIRGFRVEPGEAQQSLSRLPQVRDAAVVAGTDQRGETYLIGYVVPEAGATLTGEDLARRLAGTLPGYLIPTAWVRLNELPVNTSGKLDRAALPPPRRSRDEAGAAPVTDTEKVLHELWRTELGLGEISVDASFFALGGHSLSAVGLVNRIRTAVGVEIGVADLFRAPTIRRMALEIDKRDSTETAPASSVQQRAWHLHHASAYPAVYNVTHRIDLRGPLDIDALHRALAGLAQRHPVLRTGFAVLDGELRQVISREAGIELPVVDVGPEPDRVPAWCQTEAATPFDLDRAPLWRVRLAAAGEQHWVLVLVMHHIICDGWSIGVIARELSARYAAEVGAGSAELDTPVPYGAYVRWRQAACAQEQDRLTSFWQRRLAGADLRLPLPYDHPRPDTRLSGRGGLRRFSFPDRAVEAVRQSAKELDTTPAAVLTAVFSIWLGRLCDRNDLVLALSSASRTRPEHASVVGPVGEALLVRLTQRDGMPLADLVAQVRERTFEAIDHHLLPLREVSQLVGQELSSPQILFTVVTTPPPGLTLPGLTTEIAGVAVDGVARTELYVVMIHGDDGISLVIEYSADLFESETIQRWGEDLITTAQEACGPLG